MNIKPFVKDPSEYLPYPDYPYSPPVKGIYHNQVPRDPALSGKYSVYIPDNFEACSPAILILPPDNTSAETFWAGSIGLSWKDVSDNNGVAIIIAEAYGTSIWNIENIVTMRDDEAYIYGIVDTIRQKFDYIPSAFNLDERSLYLVGYEGGGSAAHKMAIMWPQLFAGLASVNGSNVVESLITIFGDKLSFPFIAGQNSDGRETIGLANKNIALPVWMITSSDINATAQRLKNYWITAAQAEGSETNDYAQQVYENGAVGIWVTAGTKGDTITPEIIYDEFFVNTLRFTNEPGGVLERRIDFENSDETGFIFTETEVDGYLRRWLTYIPSNYDSNASYPLIVGMHGGSNDIAAFVGDSMWQDMAEQHNLIIVFPNAYPCAYSAFSWIPTPVWNQGIPAPTSAPDDVSFIKQLIDITKQEYSIDESRIYATGHSSGGGMTWRLGLEAPEYFAAIAPAGYTVSATPDMQGISESNVVPLDAPLPVWVFMGRYDQVGADLFEEGNFNDRCLTYWGERNGFNPAVLSTEYTGTGRYFTRNWTNGNNNIPIFKYSSISLLPHIYVPYESEILWQDFFSKIIIDANGKRYYDGVEITKGYSLPSV
jgi:polyhydroxybutyrate depolymerase